ncbi:MAG: hypothetical protein N3C59_00845 [Azovibrio sp.]|nr:hypothetical protein [Azovibrio sp.]
MSFWFYLGVGAVLAWPVYRALARLPGRAPWVRRLPGCKPRHLRPYTPRAVAVAEAATKRGEHA